MWWIWMSLMSALLLGVYDVFKKQSLKKNGVLEVLFATTTLSVIFLFPFFSLGTFPDHLKMMAKAVLVTTSWVSGLAAMKTVPLTTVSTLKGFRPVLVVLFSILLFGERLSLYQWIGVALAITAIFLLGYTSTKEQGGSSYARGFVYAVISVISGAASALYDKHIISGLSPLFVQFWVNVYIALLLLIIILVSRCLLKIPHKKFCWDWRLLLIAVFIVGADMLYFFALKQDGAMLSIVSLLRRLSVAVTFFLSAIIFKERHIKGKSLALALLFSGLVLLVLAS